MTFALPDTEAERDRSWNARLPWRPRLPDSDITKWLRSTAASERDFNRGSCLMVADGEHAAHSDLPPVAAIPDLVRLNFEAVGQELLTEHRDDAN